jgi:virginiamycin B lyase
VKRSIIRSLFATTVALIALVVTAAVAPAAQHFGIPTACPPGPVPPGGTCQPAGIASGPDGNLWFTEENGNRIGRITVGGAITEFTAGLTAGAKPVEIVAGPDGRLWFTQLGRTKIGAITTSGAITEYPSGSNLNAPADGIAVGPDGALWFTEFLSGGSSWVGRMTTAGTLTDEFLLPFGSGPGDITSGPDNRLWFTEANGKIGAISTAGADFHYPLVGASPFTDPSGITASGGSLWVTDHGASTIRRVSTSGDISPPTPVGTGPSAIATGADGALWFTEETAGKIGRITTSGVLTNEFPASSPSAAPSGIAAGPDGALWFTETVGNTIGRIATSTGSGGGGGTPPPPPPPPPAASTAKKCKVPKLRGLTVKKARSKLRKAKCKYKIRGKGRVRSTVPKAGRTTTKRVTVKCKRKKAKRNGRRATAGGRLIASKGGLQ